MWAHEKGSANKNHRSCWFLLFAGSSPTVRPSGCLTPDRDDQLSRQRPACMQRPGTFELSGLLELGRKMGSAGQHRQILALCRHCALPSRVACRLRRRRPCCQGRGMFRLLSWFVIFGPNPGITNGLADGETSSCALETSQDGGCRRATDCVRPASLAQTVMIFVEGSTKYICMYVNT